MKKNATVVMGLILVLLLGTSCASSGFHSSTTRTDVRLAEANYEIVAKSVSGKGKAGYLLGASYGMGGHSQVIALARVKGDEGLHTSAMTDLWENYEEEYGSIKGKKLALVNIRYGFDALNLLFYTQPALTVQADVIEFK